VGTVWCGVRKRRSGIRRRGAGHFVAEAGWILLCPNAGLSYLGAHWFVRPHHWSVVAAIVMPTTSMVERVGDRCGRVGQPRKEVSSGGANSGVLDPGV